ncbi:ATP-binding protein [Streptomyces fructofermentans]|uniref:Histidine kinase/HSP90-like ATPase domain-containing protein n=1 Tax=Streptomyces fructofermentans TaxID=152141 RepID=A0A918KAL2_9ACTN|nr:ATP-binding protein [Streptomyces fructofermentans]GGX56682.1 hypothetical protein GCM10010515_25210 [Streptomyces fructofermentans]
MSITASPPRTARYSVALPHTPHAPSLARRASEEWLRDADPFDRVTDAVLVVSELVTNAVRHTGDDCRLTLTVRDGELDIAVADHSEEFPDMHRNGGGDEHGGFGMDVIRRLGGRIRLVPALGGKTVHVLLDLHGENDGPSPER